jgi:hypothetical protein
MGTARLYSFVGPDRLRHLRRSPSVCGPPSASQLHGLIKAQLPRGRRDGALTVTYTIDPSGQLWVADRHSEHVACADGGPVLAAGEMTFCFLGDKVSATNITNQSTGFCPEPECWPAVAAALDRLAIPHPGAFEHTFLFRRCPQCATINLIKEEVFSCDCCAADLPASWNFD